ncbi:unnamed protein product, partial [Closterium sp. NIES-53]
RGGEFSSDLLRAFCRLEGTRQTFTLPASPQQNGIAERRIGMVMDVARTSMIHAAAPHFLWPFAVQYAAHQINLQPRVSLPETTPTLWWTGKVGNASAFRVWGSRAFVRDTTADKLSSRAVPYVFLGFPRDAPGWQFYQPISRRVLSSQDVTFDESVSYYRLFPYCTASPPPPPLFLAPGTPPVDPLPPKGPAPSGVSQVDPAEPVEVAVDSGAARGADPAGAGTGGAETGGAESGGAESGGAETGRAEPGGVAPEGTVYGGAEPARVESGGALGVLLVQELLEVLALLEVVQVLELLEVLLVLEVLLELLEVLALLEVVLVQELLELLEVLVLLEVVLVLELQEVLLVLELLEVLLGLETLRLRVPVLSLLPPPVPSQSQLQPASPLPGPSPYSCSTRGLTERREPESRPVSPASRSTSPVRSVRAGRVSRPRLPPAPGTHSMTLRPSTAPQRVPLPSPPASSLPDGRTRSLTPFVLLLVDFAAACRLDYAASLVAESASVSVCPPSVEGECAFGTDVLEDRQEDLECFAAASPHLVSMLLAPEGDPDALDIPTPRSYAEAIEGPYSSQWQAAMDADMASWKSTGTYVDEVPPPGLNIVSGMWIFKVKRPPGSPPAFKACYVARGFSQRQGVEFFQTFSPTLKMTTLRVLLHVAAQRDYELHSLDFSTAFLQGSLHEEIWLRRPPGFTGSFPPGTQWSLRRPVYDLRQAPCEWHDTLRTTLAALGFAPSTADPSLFLRTDATMPPFYVLVYVDGLVFATADTEALAHVKSELQKRHTCTDL